MNPVIEMIAREVASQINKVVNLPFLDEEQEELFFRLIVTKVFQVSVGQMLDYLQTHKAEEV